MIKNTSVLLTIIFCCIKFSLFAQTSTKENSTISFSLKQALDYATKNSPVMKNAEIDLESSKKRIWEYTAIGLPQVNSKLAYSYMITLPAEISQISSLSSLGGWMYRIDNNMAKVDPTYNPTPGLTPPDPNQKVITEKDLRWGFTYDITVSQIIFSGAYLVGLQTNKELKNLSDLMVSKSENDLIESVTNAYYLVLIAQQNKILLDSIVGNTETILSNIRAFNQQGLVEETDVDQMELTLSNIKNTADMLTRQIEVAKNLLKFQAGVDMNKNIILTDNLNDLLNATDFNALLIKEFKPENNSDYKIMFSQEKLALDYLKYQKSSLLPDIAAFFNHQENFNKNAFSLTPPNMIGINANIPIFGSGMKLARIKQAKLSLEKAKNTTSQVNSGLITGFSETKSNYINSYNKYLTYKRNILIANKIYQNTLIKYKEGMASSLELTQSQTQYIQTQTNFYTSIIELANAKSKMEKMLK